CLARACRCGCQDVDACESIGQDEALDWKWRGDAEAVESPADGRAHSERRERLNPAFLPVCCVSRCKSLGTPDHRRNEKPNLPAAERQPYSHGSTPGVRRSRETTARRLPGR